MTLDRGSRDDTTARPPVSTRFLCSLAPISVSLPLPLSSSSPAYFFSSSSSASSSSSSSFVRERRQVGIRAAVNSPAPLSALMSLLLFALLNAIRAYSVSLSPCRLPLCATLPSRPLRLLASRWFESRIHSLVSCRNPSFLHWCWWINASV